MGKNLVQERDVLRRRLDEELIAKVSECLRLRIWFRVAVRNFFLCEILMSVEISPCVGAVRN